MPKKKAGDQPEKQKRRRRTSVTVGHRMVEQDGKQIRVPIRKYPSASSLTKLSDKVDELKRIHGAGGPGVLADIMFDEYARKWYEGKAGDVRENSTRQYKSIVENRIIPFIGKKQVAGILASDIKALMAKNKDMSPYTKSSTIYCLKAIFNQALDDHIISDSPARNLKRNMEDAEPRRALTQAEEFATLKYIRENPGTEEARFLAVLFFTGCREGEACGPQWKHIDFAKDQFLVRQQLVYAKGNGKITEKLKTKNSRRAVPLAPAFKSFLLQQRGLPGVFLFQKGGKHYKYSHMLTLWLTIVEQIPELSEISPHYYRHNMATRLYKAGVQVKEAARIMGESVRVMLETYTHIEEEVGLEQGSKAYDVFSDVAIL